MGVWSIQDAKQGGRGGERGPESAFCFGFSMNEEQGGRGKPGTVKGWNFRESEGLGGLPVLAESGRWCSHGGGAPTEEEVGGSVRRRGSSVPRAAPLGRQPPRVGARRLPPSALQLQGSSDAPTGSQGVLAGDLLASCETKSGCMWPK